MPQVARRRFVVASLAVAAAVTLAGCTSGKHKTADGSTAPSSSGLVSTSASGGASGSAAGSASGSAAPSGGASGGPGSSAPGTTAAANLPQAQIQATASKTGLSVRLHAGQVIQVIVPPPARQPGETTAYSVTPSGSKALTPIAGAAGFFTGAAPGTAKIVVTQTPACPKGSACPAHVVEVGSLTVTVWK